MHTHPANLRQKNGEETNKTICRVIIRTLVLDAFSKDCIRVMTIRTKPSRIYVLNRMRTSSLYLSPQVSYS